MKTIILFVFLLGTVVGAHAQSAETYYEEAKAQLEDGNPNRALKIIDKAIELEPEDPKYPSLIAKCLIELEDYMLAFRVYTDAMKLFPNNTDLPIERASLLTSLQEFDKAIEDLDHALLLADNREDSCSVLNNRSVSKTLKRDFQAAYDDIILAYKLDSTDVGILSNLANTCESLGKQDEALKYLFKAAELDSSTSHYVWGNIGFVYQKMGKYEESITYFNKVLKREPEDPLGYSNRSYSKLRLGDLKGAMKDIQESIKLYPDNSYAYRTRAFIYIEMEEINKACKDLETALQKKFTQTYGDEVLKVRALYCH